MSNGLLSASILQRDGTGQAQRQVSALSPEYIPIEERTLTDWIAFAKQYAAELNFFSTDNIAAGNWEAFLSGVNITELLAYIENPDSFSADSEQAKIYSRPHLVLFISFLQLLGFIKSQLNEFTKKHLDFYYYEILGLAKKGPLPDEANIIIQLADDVNAFFVKQGTQLFAGKDSLDKDLVYETTRDTVISQAQIQKIKTFYSGKKTITLQQISDDLSIDKTDDRLLKMMQLALGEPVPGSNLPLYKGSPVDIKVLQSIRNTPDTDQESKSYISDMLFLLQDDFMYIMDDYNAPLADWERIAYLLGNAYNQKIYQKPGERLLKMMQMALGEPGPGDDLPLYKGLPVNIEVLRMIRNDLTDEGSSSYINDKLFLQQEDFIYIIDNYAAPVVDWEKITGLLRNAYNQKAISQNTTAVNTVNSLLPEPSLEEWESAYAISDALASAFTSSSGGDTTLYFNTFGKTHNTNETAAAKLANIGFAISSPLLVLQEGIRTITLTLIFNNNGNAPTLKDVSFPFSFFISTAKGWLPITPQSFVYGNVDTKNNQPIGAAATFTKTDNGTYNAIQVQVKLTELYPAVTLPGVFDEVMTIQSNYPVLRIILNQAKDGTVNNNYALFKDLQLQNVNVQVQSEKIKTLTIQNDDAVLNYKKPFEPFGLSPETGSHFYFAHPELCSKVLDTLTVHFDWMNKPGSLTDYYKDYANQLIKSDADLKAELKLIENDIPVDINTITLFSDNTVNISDEIKQNNSGFTYSRYNAITADEEAITWQRYFSLELGSPDFQHKAYPQLLTQQAYENAVAIGKSVSNNGSADIKPPLNPPYTPKLKSFTADYTASFEIDINTGLTGEDALYHINAFGYNVPDVQTPEDGSKWVYLLPQFENEGELYIGIDNISPPQNLSLFFQLAEGSADPDLEKPHVSWSYLSNNQWQLLQGSDITYDSTNELLNSGIIKLAIPSGINCTNTLLGENLYWLRAAVTTNADAIPDTVSITTHGIAAAFIDSDNAPEHYLTLLPPGSINGTVDVMPEIKKISQPYSSSKGKPAEDDSHFYVRVSERLRHKARALTMWDYEHMILEQFPEIYKVKCVPGDSIGSADIIVIPDIKGKLPFNPFQPKAPADVIKNIQQYIEQHIAAWAEVKVKNPSYIQVKVRIAVKINEDYSTDFFVAKLEEELIKYLAPWAYDEGADIFIDRRIDADVIVNFAAERFYVEYISDVHLFTSRTGEDFTEVSAVNGEIYVQAEKPGDILVSAAEHVIDVIEDAYKEKNYKGIGYMKIELDFKIG